MRLRSSHIIAFLAVVSAASALTNFSIDDAGKELVGLKTRRKKGSSRSTSSSSGERSKKDGDDEKNMGSSLGLSTSSSSSESSEERGRNKNNKYRPKSTEERRGWRKWHRKCTPCPSDMVLKWRDPQIKWICGGYQRARRSFKSDCMMHYRNCQDGTMFVKIHSHRCKNDTDKMDQHGEHFFYDYKASLSDDSSSDSSSSSSEEDSSSSSGSGSFEWRRAVGKPISSASPPLNTTITNITVGATTNKI